MNIVSIILMLFFTTTTIANNKKLLKEIPLGHESDCGPVRMDLPPGIMSKIPIGDQSGIDNCWAYPSAACVDAWRLKNENPFTDFTSPLALSLEFAEFKKLPSIAASSSPYDVLYNINSLTGCSKKTISDFMNNHSNHSFLSELRETYTKSEGKNIESITSEVNKCLQKAGIKHKFEIDKVASLLKSNHWINYLNGVMTDVCKNSQIKYQNIPKPKITQAKTFGSAKKAAFEMKNVIDTRLNMANPSPVGITFCNSMLENRDHVTMSDNGVVGVNDTSACPSGSHAATIVGRRMVLYADNNGEFKKENYICQYLVRDSRGTTCNGYPDSTLLKPADKCINGQKWVEEDILLTNTAESYYIGDN
jgi:hypothetical protein